MKFERFLLEHGDALRRAAVLVAFCGVVAVLVFNAGLHDAFIGLLQAATEIIERHPGVGVVVFVIAAALSAMLAFVSVTVIVPIAVYTWGAPFSAFLLWTGWVLGGALSYSAGRAFGRPIARFMVSQSTLDKIESKVHDKMRFSRVLLLQLALPSEIPSYLLGTVRYGFAKFLPALLLAELPYTFATILLSEGLVERKTLQLLIAGLGTIALSVGAVFLMKRRLANRH